MTLRQTNSFGRLLLWVFFSITIISAIIFSCNDSNDPVQSPEGYNFSAGYRYTLPDELNEISGLSYYPKDSSVFAINDEKGFLFKIHFSQPLGIERWKFGSGGDYEDIVFVDSTFYVLKSKGSIDKFRFTEAGSISLQNFPIPAAGKNEFETLYYDDSLKKLIAVCKNCEVDNKSQVTCFMFNPLVDSFENSFQFDTEKFNKENDEKERFKPSAAAIHPLTGELFVIASVNHELVIWKKDRSLKGVYHLDSKLFKQPEGMTFTPKGDLLISNEAGSVGQADILIFKYNPLNKRQ